MAAKYIWYAQGIVMTNNEDNLTLTEAMNGPDSVGFMDAMEKEIQTLIQIHLYECGFLCLDFSPQKVS